MHGEALREALAGADGVFAVGRHGGHDQPRAARRSGRGVAAVCRERDVWLHVDGAYGAAGLCAPSVRERFAGIEHADSLIVDPHKWLFAPFDSCALLYREPALGRAAHRQSASYLDALYRDEEAWNPSDYGLHLTRRARGIPFWFSLAVHGTDAYAAAVERTLEVTRAGRRGDPRAAPSSSWSPSRSCRSSPSAATAGPTRTTTAGRRGCARPAPRSCSRRRCGARPSPGSRS